jgi:hypothetical protein
MEQDQGDRQGALAATPTTTQTNRHTNGEAQAKYELA